MIKRERKKKLDELSNCEVRNENFAFVNQIMDKNICKEIYHYYNDTLNNDICLINNT